MLRNNPKSTCLVAMHETLSNGSFWLYDVIVSPRKFIDCAGNAIGNFHVLDCYIILVDLLPLVGHVWISNHIPSKVWDEITYPFPNFDGCIGEVWKWISKFISYLVMGVITHATWTWIHVSKGESVEKRGASGKRKSRCRKYSSQPGGRRN